MLLLTYVEKERKKKEREKNMLILCDPATPNRSAPSLLGPNSNDISLDANFACLSNCIACL
jgi:hypothetical protein